MIPEMVIATMTVNDLSSMDIIMVLLLVISGWVLLREKGFKKGGGYLLALLFVGSIFALVSAYFDNMSKYLLIAFILIVGFLWNKRKPKDGAVK